MWVGGYAWEEVGRHNASSVGQLGCVEKMAYSIVMPMVVLVNVMCGWKDVCVWLELLCLGLPPW